MTQEAEGAASQLCASALTHAPSDEEHAFRRHIRKADLRDGPGMPGAHHRRVRNRGGRHGARWQRCREARNSGLHGGRVSNALDVGRAGEQSWLPGPQPSTAREGRSSLGYDAFQAVRGCWPSSGAFSRGLRARLRDAWLSARRAVSAARFRHARCSPTRLPLLLALLPPASLRSRRCWTRLRRSTACACSPSPRLRPRLASGEPAKALRWGGPKARLRPAAGRESGPGWSPRGLSGAERPHSVDEGRGWSRLPGLRESATNSRCAVRAARLPHCCHALRRPLATLQVLHAQDRQDEALHR